LIETALALIPNYGGPALFVLAGLSCFGLPIPGSIALLASGAFVAGGDMALATALSAGLAGAVAGDQAGYWLGVGLGRRAVDAMSGHRGMRAALTSAEAISERRGALAIFLSRWLIAPLGPAVNVMSGTIRMPWLRFSIPEVLGEVVWVAIYVSLGAAFSRSIVALAELLGDLTWFLAAGVIAVALLLRLLSHGRSAGRAQA
jgi:membrane protein DedA with SNARE-associated domain